MSYHFEKRFDFTNSKKIKTFANQELELYLTFSSDSVISSLYYFSSEKLPSAFMNQLSLLAKIVEELKLEDVLELSWLDLVESDDTFNLEEDYERGALAILCEPLYFIQVMVAELLGERSCFTPIEHDDEVICFCFSVKKSEIISLLSEKPKAKLIDLTNALDVAGACQSCVDRVQKLIYTVRKSGIDYSKISLGEIEQKLVSWSDLANYFKMGLMHLERRSEDKLYFKVKNPEKFSDLSWRIEEYLFRETDYYFQVIFTAE